jgi:hypothetical protein
VYLPAADDDQKRAVFVRFHPECRIHSLDASVAGTSFGI